jgi:molybdate transport system substrate-binding protein
MTNTVQMMKTFLWIKGLAVALGCLSLSGLVQADPVRVFAAASLQGPLDQIGQNWPDGAAISYAGSGTVARQISLGAPADLVILANAAWMDWLSDQGHITAPATDLLSNRLVLIGPAGSAPMQDPKAADLLARLGGGRMAMGQHMSVPAGIYGKAWLDTIGAWDALRPHLAETDNVRAALVLVARGEMPLGLVYASDAVSSPAVDILWAVPPAQHPPIRYPAAALTPAGAAFLDHLRSQTAVFVAAGFEAVP